ncbi:MAG TPA: TIGR01777 family oxidoreductase [Alphaproteobacteria bacterium]|nr:TIGR01777 family oxidoreductase [Alphaproteobacteria bacterium]
MSAALILLTLQGLLGAFDNLWNHEIQVGLAGRPGARRELLLHAVRQMLYAVVFVTLGWLAPMGAFAWAFAGLLLVELLITLWDFVEEDRTRRLSPTERVTHTLLTVNYGAVLGLVAPEWWRWAQAPTGLEAAERGPLAWVMTLYAMGVLLWGGRELLAGLRFATPDWRRRPFAVGRSEAPLHVVVTGGTGFIGRHLVRRLVADGHGVTVLTRDPALAEFHFGPHAAAVSSLSDIPAGLRVDAVVNLAGAPTLGGPWTARRRRLLRESRTATTRAVVDWLAGRAQRPAVLVSGSAIGFYGRRGDEGLDEAAAPRPEFMSRLCQDWEAEAGRAAALGVRVVALRIGLVLGRGGMLAGLLPSFRLGLGAVLGDGRQWWSWVHIDDLVGLILHALADGGLSGPVNATAPEPVPQREFGRMLGRRLRRPVRLRLPAGPLRLLLGEMAELLLAGQRVLPAKAEAAGYRFRHPTLDRALEAIDV